MPKGSSMKLRCRSRHWGRHWRSWKRGQRRAASGWEGRLQGWQGDVSATAPPLLLRLKWLSGTIRGATSNNAQQATHLCSHLSYMYYTLYSFSRILCKHTHKYKLWLLDAHFNYSSCYVIECGCVECVEFLTKRWDKFLVYGNGYRCSAKFSNLFKLIVQNASNIFASMSLEIQTCEQMGHCCFLFPLPLQRQGCRVSTWLSFPTGVEWACTTAVLADAAEY